MSVTQVGPGDVTARMQKLERQNRRLHIGLVVLGVMTVAALFFDARPAITQPASATFGTLTAHAFVLTDQSGKTRASLFFEPWGQPALVFWDPAGKPRVTVSLGSHDKPFFDMRYRPPHRKAEEVDLGWGMPVGPGLSLIGKNDIQISLSTWGSGMLDLGGSNAAIFLRGTKGRVRQIRAKNIELWGSRRLIERTPWP
jgi:hypothetical protein